MQQNKSCPLCGSKGQEIDREPITHPKSGKLIERVTLRCPNHGGVFIEFDESCRDYGYHREMKQHPESVADGEPVAFTPDVKPKRKRRKKLKIADAIQQSQEAQVDVRALIRQSIRKYSS